MEDPKMSEAYVRAAFAVVAYSLGTMVDEIIMDSSGGDHGHVHYKRNFSNHDPAPDMREIVSYLAGPFAQRKAFPHDPCKHHGSFDDKAVDFARDLGYDEDETMAILEEAEKLAAKFAEQYWAEIEAVAHALFEKNTLSGSELKEIYDTMKLHHSLNSLNLRYPNSSDGKRFAGLRRRGGADQIIVCGGRRHSQ